MVQGSLVSLLNSQICVHHLARHSKSSSYKGYILKMECRCKWQLCSTRRWSGDKKPPFFSCSYSSHVWTALTTGFLNHSFTTSWVTLLPILTTSSNSRHKSVVMRYAFQTTIHSIWRERNRRRREESHTKHYGQCKLYQIRRHPLLLVSNS